MSGDDKTAAEVQALAPGVVTTVVKTGVTRLCAELCPPQEARERLRADVESAVRRRGEAKPLMWDGRPLTLTFTRAEFCDRAASCPGVKRLDGRTLELAGETYEEIYLSFLACVRLSDVED